MDKGQDIGRAAWMPFVSSDLIEIVGIRSIYLNKFVERQLYGIKPSLRLGEGRGSRRLFTLDDLLGIALVWWLFEAGLRTEVIKRVLKELSKTAKSDANLAMKALQESRGECLLITRDMRLGGTKEKRKTPQDARYVEFATVDVEIHELDTESMLVLPVSRLLQDLLSRLKLFLAAKVKAQHQPKPRAE